MLKKIFKMAKKAAPIIGAGLGFLYGGPMLGSAIGGGLGSLVAGKSPEEALKFAAMAGLTGGALSKFGGMQAGQGLSGLFNKGAGAMVTQPGASVTQAKTAASLAKPSIFSQGLGLIKANPIKSALLGLGLGAAASSDDDRGTMDIEKVYGTQSPFRDLGQANMGGTQLIPYGSSGRPYGYQMASGGIISLADGGDFPRKNGPIKGPGTETSDEIPAMLSDGEFVVNAKTVRGLGSKLGGRGREDERERGSKYLYDMQNRYGRA